MTNSLFIAIEGIDGSGKSTLAGNLAKLLWRSTRPGPDICLTREPYDPIPPGHTRGRIRIALSAPPGWKMHPAQLAIMFAADRFAHLEDVVEPALARGETVVCDRYKLSTIAYQTLKLDEDFVFQLVEPARDPDVTVLLDMDPEVSMARLVARGLPLESYERSMDTQIKLRQHYLDYATRQSTYYGGRVIIVPADVTAKLAPDTLALYVRRRVLDRANTPYPPMFVGEYGSPARAQEAAQWAVDVARAETFDRLSIYEHTDMNRPYSIYEHPDMKAKAEQC